MSSSGLTPLFVPGQVAQLVEQGTENPRVGGSTPSLATFLLCVVSALSGCSDDPCAQLCLDLVEQLDECRPEWGLTWEAFGAESRADWRTRCQNDWDTVRADLEAREVPAAEDQCLDASADLVALQDGDTTCDVLRALYVE